MRTKIMIGLSLLILVALNYGIYQKEQILKNGQAVLFELAPVDPRSLMQGDYMRLRYAIEGKIPVDDKTLKKGILVIKPDENNIAQFVRFHNDTTLTTGEQLVPYHLEYTSIKIVPDTFMFQEGHARLYERARYGIFKFDSAGNKILTGLADADRKVIEPTEEALKAIK